MQIGLLAVPTTGPLSMYLQGQLQSYYVSTPDQSLMQEDQPQLKSKALRDSDNKTPQPPSSRGCNQHSPTPWSLNQRSPSCSMDDFVRPGTGNTAGTTLNGSIISPHHTPILAMEPLTRLTSTVASSSRNQNGVYLESREIPPGSST